MKKYAVCISDDTATGEAVFIANNKTEARQMALAYIRSWQIRNAVIEYIREVTN